MQNIYSHDPDNTDDYDPDEFSDIVFFTLHVNEESEIDINTQLNFFQLLFVHPEISAKQAWDYLFTDFDSLDHDELMAKWEIELDRLVRRTNTFLKQKQLEKKIAKKVVEWTRQFLLPKPMDIEQIAFSLCLSEESINHFISVHYLNGEFTIKELCNYLRRFSPVLPWNIIDALLDQYNYMK
jgi:hypothetical protein